MTNAVFVGGPRDGQVDYVQLQDGRPPEVLRVPVPTNLIASYRANPHGAPEDVMVRGPEIMEYRLHLDGSGHASRTDDGSFRYVYRRNA